MIHKEYAATHVTGNILIEIKNIEERLDCAITARQNPLKGVSLYLDFMPSKRAQQYIKRLYVNEGYWWRLKFYSERGGTCRLKLWYNIFG
jgi:hypothetical protein